MQTFDGNSPISIISYCPTTPHFFRFPDKTYYVTLHDIIGYLSTMVDRSWNKSKQNTKPLVILPTTPLTAFVWNFLKLGVSM